MQKEKYNLDQAMNSLIKTAEFQQNFEIPKLSQYDSSLDSTILHILDLSNQMERLGGQQASQQLLKIAQEILDDVQLNEPDNSENVLDELEKKTYEPFHDMDDEYTKSVENELLKQRHISDDLYEEDEYSNLINQPEDYYDANDKKFNEKDSEGE